MIQRLTLSPALAEDNFTLDAAYTFCADLTREHSKSFYFSTRFLPAEKKRAIRAFYAFCRATDDIVDHLSNETNAAQQLAYWRTAARLPGKAQRNPILSAWADTRDRYHVPQNYIEELIDGCQMDLRVNRYDTFDDLRQYCYRVASTVGLVSMHIIGVNNDDERLLQQAQQCATTLGIALQLTNILRDVGEDWQRGRVYLPQEDLRRFGYSEDDLRAGVSNERFRALMRFEIERTHRLYDEGWHGIAYLNREGRLAVGAAIGLYRNILDRIAQNDFDVFTRRAHLSLLGKIKRIPGIYLNVRALDPQPQNTD